MAYQIREWLSRRAGVRGTSGLIFVASLVIACSSSTPPATQAPTLPSAATKSPALQPTATPKPVVPVGFQTAFGFGGEYAPFFLALDKGYYKDAGLDLTILRGTSGANTTQAVDQGTVAIGMADASAAVILRSKGGHIKIVGILLNSTPVGFAGLDITLNRPADLENKSIAMAPFDSTVALLQVFAELNNIDLAKIKVVNVTPDLYASTVISGQVDMIPAWQASGTWARLQIYAEQSGRKTGRLAIRDWGMDIYGDSFLVNDSFLASSPALVRGFLAATYKGVQDAIADPRAAVDSLMRNRPELDRAQSTLELTNAIELFLADTTAIKGWGYIDPAKLQRTIDVIAKGVGISTPATAQDVATNEFLPGP